MKKSKAISAATILVCLWLLFGLNMMFVYAENIPISPGGVEKIGVNKIRLESGIGVIVFDMSKDYSGYLTADGYLTLSNTFNDSFNIQCKIITTLSTVDVDVDGKPRVHPTISKNTVFVGLPSKSYVSLEDDTAVIEPLSIYNFHYHLELSEDDVLGNNMGYLFYINIGRDISNSSGANIGINYNYKVFIMFINVKEENSVFSSVFYFIIPPGIVIGIIMVYRKKHGYILPDKKLKKAEKTVKKTPIVVKHEPIKKPSGVSNIDSRVDDLFRRLDSG